MLARSYLQEKLDSSGAILGVKLIIKNLRSRVFQHEALGSEIRV
jgi:hypothetical protein